MKRPLREHISSRSLQLMGIPRKFLHTTIDDFICNSEKGKEVRNFIKNYIDNLSSESLCRDKGVIFFGSNGTGKTMLSSIVAKEAYRNRLSVRRCTFVDYVNIYTRVWSAKNSEDKEALEDDLYSSYKAVEFLVLEEVGKEIDSKISAPVLEDLLRYREDNGLITFICTNINKNDLKNRYGDSVMSLIMGNMYPITLVGEDWRKV